MGKGTSTTGIEQANFVWTAAVTATGQTVLGVALGYFNLFIYGIFVGTVQLEKSFDGGTTWIAASLDTAGDAASYTVPVSVTGFECEKGVYYRINCTAFNSGTINVRMSGNVNFANSAFGA